MKGKIIPFGYANSGVTELERLMKDVNTYLVDIRLSPQSQWQDFNKGSLQARFPNRYMHMPELGNVNYRNRLPIQIASPDQGIARLINGIRQGYTIVLMCGCKEYESCHRHTVVNLLQDALSEVQIEMKGSVKPCK